MPPLCIGRTGLHAAEVPFDGARLTVGSAASCDLVLAAGAAPEHVVFERGPGGVVLRVAPGAMHVYVNARPVRELALLRVGDAVSVGTDTLLLRIAARTVGTPLPIGEIVPPPPGSASLVGLRVVAGPLCGRRIAIDGGENLDSLSLPGVEGCLRLRVGEGRVAFDYRGDAGDAAPCCDGRRAAQGSLGGGDQIAWGQHRLILEMPLALPPMPQQPPVLRAAPVQPPAAPAGTGIWWLIGTAAVIALAISILLFVRT